jgi:hypothetical protein
MKNFFSTLLLVAVFSFAFSQSSHKSSTVGSVLGVPVFVMSEPDSPYDVTGQVTDDDAVSVLNAVNGTSTYRTIKESCTVIVTNAQRKAKKGKFDFDAVIISDDGHNGTCIKWKDDSTSK